MIDTFGVLQTFQRGDGQPGKLYSLPALEKKLGVKLSRLPVSIRVMLESLVRNCDGKRVSEQDVKNLAAWTPKGERVNEVPFVVARVLLQDFTGVPLLVDLAAMRSAVKRFGKDPRRVEPIVPVDLVVDHSVQVDVSGVDNALDENMRIEFERNRPRYEFLKWGMTAFDTFRIVPPGVGICHQVNLEHLARGVFEKDGVTYPDTLVGTDSHTVMVNGIGVLGWGVGGIEAEAGMLGQPNYLLMPDVVGVHMTGALQPGVTATDLVLHVTQMLRKAKVVGKFVEFFGPGAESLTATDRATLGNMAPEYGATCGFFPVDGATLDYLRTTGRSEEQVKTVAAYYKAQGLFGMPKKGEVDYSDVLELDLATVVPSVAGPKRPQDKIELTALKQTWRGLLMNADLSKGFGKGEAEIGKAYRFEKSMDGVAKSGGQMDPKAAPLSVVNTNPATEREMMHNRPTPDAAPGWMPGLRDEDVVLRHGDVLIAAITSCTNTSNPSVMLGAGLLAKKAIEKGLRVKPTVKTSLAPGSRVVTEYLQKTGLQKHLDQLGFQTVGYGCTTCIGNSGPLDPRIEGAVTKNDVVGASVLSGNRNFEARVHQSVKANFLMSPPLVVAFALAGTVDIDLTKEPIGKGKDGKDVFLKDIWPSAEELAAVVGAANDAASYKKMYASFEQVNRMWNDLKVKGGPIFEWDGANTYIQEPPYFIPFSMDTAPVHDVKGARPLAIFGDSITTDHISPAGAIKASSPAGLYLQSKDVTPADFNSYGARRGNHQVMVRGTFANVRIKNQMVPGTEGGVTARQPEAKKEPIYDAAVAYEAAKTPLVVIAGSEYGTGSSRDWAAKGTLLLGVKAVVAKSFERIHRSNLVGMGVLPLQFPEGVDASTLKLDGTETYDVTGLEAGLKPQMTAKLVVHRKDGKQESVDLKVRIDTPIEVEYYRHGGILPYVLRQIVARS